VRRTTGGEVGDEYRGGKGEEKMSRGGEVPVGINIYVQSLR